MALIADHHRRGAAPRQATDRRARRDEAGSVDRREVGGVDLELRQPRDILGGAVGEMGHHAELLAVGRPHLTIGRQDLDPHDPRRLRVARASPLGDPAGDAFVGRGARLDEFSTAVRHGGRGLEEEQAHVGRDDRHPPPAGLLDQVLVVLGWLEPQQGKPEAVLPAALPVAAATVAAVLGENRHDLRVEVERQIGGGACGGPARQPA